MRFICWETWHTGHVRGDHNSYCCFGWGRWGEWKDISAWEISGEDISKAETWVTREAENRAMGENTKPEIQSKGQYHPESPSNLVKGSQWRASPLLRPALRIVPFLLYSSGQVCAALFINLLIWVLWAPNYQFLRQGWSGHIGEKRPLLSRTWLPGGDRTDPTVTVICSLTHGRTVGLLRNLGRRFCPALLSILPFLPTVTMRLSWRRGRWCTDWDTVESWSCWASS